MADSVLKLIFKGVLFVAMILLSVNAVAQKQLVIKPVSDVLSFVPEDNTAAVIILSPIINLNVESTLGEGVVVEITRDSLYQYSLLFDISEERKRVISISAPGYVKEYLRLILNSKQKVVYTAFPPVDEDRFKEYKMLGYAFSGYGPWGAMFAYGKRFGAYLRANTSFRSRRGFNIESRIYEGEIFNPSGAEKIGVVRSSFTAGLQVAMIPNMFFQVGAGYGLYANQWSKNKDYFYSDLREGVQLDFGLLYNYKSLYLNAGVYMITASKVLSDFHLGIGYVF